MTQEGQERAAWFGRPRLGRAVALHTVVLPDSPTMARLVVYGWGWLSVRAAAAPRAVPALRRFVRGRTELELRVPAGQVIAVSVSNPWGRARANFVIAPTEPGSPLPAGLPAVAVPAAGSTLPRLPSSVAAPPLVSALRPHVRLPDAALAARRAPRMLVPGALGTRPAGAARAWPGAGLRRALQALRDGTYLN